ncbi:hypothetical protein P389DRAFT_195061 [Cystobasidium minutum MCA 4210]|uniref:uncharacterized protein n=1 Tax=Cystobasidium minutum MCA 4210 TaxID=1397322 RepID=UPI0034CEAC35|eukprot:jgi/Rhomi1/195061/gm1.3275_g
MNALSRREEETILKDLKKQALKTCDDVVRDFAACSQGRTISVVWTCGKHWRAMQGCMREQMSERKTDEAKLEYLREKRRQSLPIT